ncbi:MAG: hypothetical protein IPJ88_15545 [Myxococcales bacterium]|nr:MAG: hypothetical protein IPJ88_15545 [Myxococcales bacterium]
MNRHRKRAPWVIVAASALSLSSAACDDESPRFCDPCQSQCDSGTCNPPPPYEDAGNDGNTPDGGNGGDGG